MSKNKGIMGFFTITLKFFKIAFLILIFPITLIVWIVKKIKKKKAEKAAQENDAYTQDDDYR